MAREIICKQCEGTGNRRGWATWQIDIPETNDFMWHEHLGFLKAMIAISRNDLGLLPIKREEMTAKRVFHNALAEELNGCDKCHGKGTVTVNETHE